MPTQKRTNRAAAGSLVSLLENAQLLQPGARPAAGTLGDLGIGRNRRRHDARPLALLQAAI
jgi:hypothetical protein